ncbi:3-deoxy-7-phosphoheptulonate synthase [Actinomadura viridis]|uniref:Phospho-2-dehydro-3-deoxyheptonate aldolase n=1 Tax=Actinomadura viridis TaxID=58110 RepID=A0A931DCL3_9ACTN|nr:3-deoxy-7-phosphoheptulonate synthase [Actinomadura viridis]MBG6085947.1 3-deoxy-7-phosphoheptulonate synthase [Actinomadura viridis]
MTLATPGVRPSQQPAWPSPDRLAEVRAELAARPAPVGPAAVRRLRGRLAAVARGEGHLLQGGDCVELFAEVSAQTTRAKVAQIRALATLIEHRTGRAAVPVARLAGQFAKPRSQDFERLPSGEVLPVFRGDAVNGPEPRLAARTPDPGRLRRAYHLAGRVLAALPPDGDRGAVFASHESLLLDYETALVRVDPATGARYCSSGHLLWIGERTRAAGGPHVEFAAGIANPVAVKLGPGTDPGELAALVERLDPGRVPGRLTLIPRMGAALVEARLPALVETVRELGSPAIWLCDPMHGNTVRLPSGRKCRAMSAMLTELQGFLRVLREYGRHPGGVHLEMTPHSVTECVDSLAPGGAEPPLPRYTTGCDPRLNRTQAARLVAGFAAALAATDRHRR